LLETHPLPRLPKPLLLLLKGAADGLPPWAHAILAEVLGPLALLLQQLLLEVCP
jgi:hypothetical protein